VINYNPDTVGVKNLMNFRPLTK